MTMDNNIKLKKATLADIEALQQVSIQTFTETYSYANTAENMKNYIETYFNTERLTKELIDNNIQFWLATDDEKIIGYLKLNFGTAQTELKNENAFEIERIYVLQEYQRKKVGEQFRNKAIEIAKESKVDFIWLGVWEHNRKAINFYTKNGFTIFNTHVFKLGEDVQTDYMMKLEIKQ